MDWKFYRYLPARRWLMLDGMSFVCNRLIAYLPSRRLRLAFYRHVCGFVIGPRSYIMMGAWFDAVRGLKMGASSVINQGCRLDTRGTIEIGEHVSISAEVCILTADHDPQSPTFAGRMRPVRIEDYVFVGTRAMLLPGVTVSTTRSRSFPEDVSAMKSGIVCLVRARLPLTDWTFFLGTWHIFSCLLKNILVSPTPKFIADETTLS